MIDDNATGDYEGGVTAEWPSDAKIWAPSINGDTVRYPESEGLPRRDLRWSTASWSA